MTDRELLEVFLQQIGIVPETDQQENGDTIIYCWNFVDLNSEIVFDKNSKYIPLK